MGCCPTCPLLAPRVCALFSMLKEDGASARSTARGLRSNSQATEAVHGKYNHFPYTEHAALPCRPRQVQSAVRVSSLKFETALMQALQAVQTSDRFRTFTNPQGAPLQPFTVCQSANSAVK